MHVTVSATGRRSSALGFSLLEVVIAAGLLLMTVTVVSACITSVSRGGARVESAMDADRALCAVAERLRGLQFCAATYPDHGTSRGVDAGDLVAAVFPHARLAENAETAYYVATGQEGDAGAGSFVTLVDEGGVDVRCVARFLASEDGEVLGPADLDGWSVDEGTGSPGPVLRVRLTAAGGSANRSVLVTRGALATPPIGQRSSSDLGAPA